MQRVVAVGVAPRAGLVGPPVLRGLGGVGEDCSGRRAGGSGWGWARARGELEVWPAGAPVHACGLDQVRGSFASRWGSFGKGGRGLRRKVFVENLGFVFWEVP